MPSPYSRKRFAFAVLALLSLLACLGFVVMGALSYRRYTSVGIDRDTDDGAGNVWHTHYRVQWRGDGSCRLGGSAFRQPRNLNRLLEPFDWGGTFFQPPRPHPVASVWNSFGFSIDHYAAPDKGGTFLGIPVWIPVALFAPTPLTWLRQNRRGSARRHSASAKEFRPSE